jgi:hypothetical protein
MKKLLIILTLFAFVGVYASPTIDKDKKKAKKTEVVTTKKTEAKTCATEKNCAITCKEAATCKEIKPEKKK